MNAADLLRDLRARGFELTAEDGRLIVRPGSELTHEDRSRIGAVVDELRTLLRAADALDLRPVKSPGSIFSGHSGDEAPLFDLEEQIQQFIFSYDGDDDGGGCTRKAILRGVDGPDAEIEEALDALARYGIPVRRDDSKTPPEYVLRERAKRCDCGRKIGPSAEVCVDCKRTEER